MGVGALLNGTERYTGIMEFRLYPRSALLCVSVGAWSEEDARQLCWEEALNAGWTNPRWWQWWRRKERREPVVHPSL